MTGPENYSEAERYAQQAAEYASKAVAAASTDSPAEVAKFREWAAHAREMGTLHATLAVAAATALGAYNTMDPLDRNAWDDVAGVHESPSGGDS